MNYADRISDAGRPRCFGSVQAYNPSDEECRNCRYLHTCRTEIESKTGSRPASSGFVPIRRVTTQDSPRRQNEDDSAWQPGLTKEGENPMTRLAKDAFVGALRGASKETYEFFRYYRIG